MKTVEENRRERLVLLEKEFGSQVALSEKIGKSPAQISQWKNASKYSGSEKRRVMDRTTARHIEKMTGKPEGWLDYQSESNVEEGPRILGYIPLISWVQAGVWTETINNFATGDAEEWLPCPVKHSAQTFAIKVRGESMMNPHSRPSFYEGDLLFVDPHVEAQHGALVVVRLEDTNESTFKKLIFEGNKRYLRALNPAWPEQIIEMNEHAVLCGVVIAKIERW